jgi:hypothetical protein
MILSFQRSSNGLPTVFEKALEGSKDAVCIGISAMSSNAKQVVCSTVGRRRIFLKPFSEEYIRVFKDLHKSSNGLFQRLPTPSNGVCHRFSDSPPLEGESKSSLEERALSSEGSCVDHNLV